MKFGMIIINGLLVCLFDDDDDDEMFQDLFS